MTGQVDAIFGHVDTTDRKIIAEMMREHGKALVEEAWEAAENSKERVTMANPTRQVNEDFHYSLRRRELYNNIAKWFEDQ